jgi:tryptophan-rich sensory protein
MTATDTRGEEPMEPVWTIFVIAIVITAVIAWRTFGRRQ